MGGPVVVRAEGAGRDEVVRLMDELIAWWPQRPNLEVGVAGGTCHLQWVRDTFAAAEVIDPPKPDEPSGGGAVVEDRDGRYWTLIAPDSRKWANYGEHGYRDYRDYADLCVVRVVSEGVQ